MGGGGGGGGGGGFAAAAGHNPVSDRVGGGESIVYMGAYAPSLHADTNYSEATFYEPVREG